MELARGVELRVGDQAPRHADGVGGFCGPHEETCETGAEPLLQAGLPLEEPGGVQGLGEGAVIRQNVEQLGDEDVGLEPGDELHTDVWPGQEHAQPGRPAFTVVGTKAKKAEGRALA